MNPFKAARATYYHRHEFKQKQARKILALSWLEKGSLAHEKENPDSRQQVIWDGSLAKKRFVESIRIVPTCFLRQTCRVIGSLCCITYTHTCTYRPQSALRACALTCRHNMQSHRLTQMGNSHHPQSPTRLPAPVSGNPGASRPNVQEL